MNFNREKDNELLGTWITDPEDVRSIQLFGKVKLHFTADGQLTYTILGEQKDQKMMLTYQVKNNVSITDQPSAPSERRKSELTFESHRMKS